MAERLLSDRAASGGRTPVPARELAVPPGFEVFRCTPGPGKGVGLLRGVAGPGERIVIMKSYLRDRLLEAGAHDPSRLSGGPLVAGWILGGRTRHALIRSEGEAWVLKEYRRGGFLGRWNSSRYWGSGRFIEELRVAALAEEAGVPTAEVLALILEGAGFGSVRAWLVTRYLPDVRPISEFLGDAREAAMFRAVGQVVRRMHAAGIDHHDLHLGNIVGSFEGRSPRAHIVDWDRARSHEGKLWVPYGNLVRLWRSLEKGRRLGGWLGLGHPVRAFIRGYFEGRPGALRDARRYFRRRAISLGVRGLFWRAWR